MFSSGGVQCATDELIQTYIHHSSGSGKCVFVCVVVCFVQDVLPELCVKRTQDVECEPSFYA